MEWRPQSKPMPTTCASMLTIVLSCAIPQISRFLRNIQYLGDVKAGTFVGSDVAGNKYYEDLNEVPGRHRWVEFAQNDTFNASQVEPVWHAWLHHIQDLPPPQDQRLKEVRRTWEAVSRSNKPSGSCILDVDTDYA